MRVGATRCILNMSENIVEYTLLVVRQFGERVQAKASIFSLLCFPSLQH